MPIADIDYKEYFTTEALDKLARAFSHYDVDGTGTIGEADLHAIFRGLGRTVSKQQLREIFKNVDYNDSGSIEFEEFCVAEIMLSQLRPHPALIDYQEYLPESVVKALERLFGKEDSFGAGAVGLPAVCRIFEAMGSKLQKEDIEEVFRLADTANVGQLDFSSLAALWAVATGQRKRCNYREFLSLEQVETLRAAFQDVSGKGHVGRGELEALMRRVGVIVRKAQLEWLMRAFDTDSSGDIDFEEFAVMVLRLRGFRRQRVISPHTCRCEDLWRDERFTIRELQQAGFGLRHFRDAGIPAGRLHLEGGVGALELRRAGYNPAELRHGGLSATELRRSGFSLADLRIAGFSDRVLEEANRQLKASFSAGDLAVLPQTRPVSKGAVGAPVRGATLSGAGAAQLLPASPLKWQLPPRPMTQMIREHTDWRPRLARARHLVAAGTEFLSPGAACA